ncbi:Oidioi.mRNA.OKI2018_I69.PAR.g8582.t1.cds [Oikopleura dioica]|uniref:Oidioi.mRNA.OKI2018_I69.PAR.g8582.t1.cds n=1 Tax=Oikopleura dioica TaxID=34765 RepID=A0ABN7RMG8_OIKDI|nr:Oidioi.mRNA.OKI2018_I69.PAR.g8582.t1.cds [Oikopleura dioica]
MPVVRYVSTGTSDDSRSDSSSSPPSSTPTSLVLRDHFYPEMSGIYRRDPGVGGDSPSFSTITGFTGISSSTGFSRFVPDEPVPIFSLAVLPVAQPSLPDYSKRVPCIASRPNADLGYEQDELSRLLFAPGNPASGTEDWITPPQILVGFLNARHMDSSHDADFSHPRDVEQLHPSTGELWAVKRRRLGAPPPTPRVLAVDSGRPANSWSIHPSFSARSTARDEADQEATWRVESGTVDAALAVATHRSVGTGTSLGFPDLLARDVDSLRRGTSLLAPIETPVKSRNLASASEVSRFCETYRHDRVYRQLGLERYLPVLGHNQPIDDTCHALFRPTPDSRFTVPLLPKSSSLGLPGPDYYPCEWPDRFCSDPDYAGYDIEEDIQAARDAFAAAGGQMHVLEHTRVRHNVELFDHSRVYRTVVVVPPDNDVRTQGNLLPDPLEVGLFDQLTKGGYADASVLDRIDFGKSLCTLGSPTVLDTATGTGFLSELLDDPRYWDPERGVTRLADLLSPILRSRDWFDPSSPLWRPDIQQIHHRNDCLHWGYPLTEGLGENPFGYEGFTLADTIFAACRLEHLYPKETDRRVICLILGLDVNSIRPLFLISPFEMYQLQLANMIRPYTLVNRDDGDVPRDPECPLGRERLRLLDVGHWSTQAADVDAHGLGVLEVALIGLSVLAAEFSLTPICSLDGEPAFYFDHRARFHDGLILSGGNGGLKRGASFLAALLCGCRPSTDADPSTIRDGASGSGTSKEVSAPKCYYDATTGRRFPPVPSLTGLRPGESVVAPYQSKFVRSTAFSDEAEPIRHVGMTGYSLKRLDGVPRLTYVREFEATGAAVYATVKHLQQKGSYSMGERTSNRFPYQLLPASFQEWYAAGAHCKYYGGTTRDVVDTILGMLSDAERLTLHGGECLFPLFRGREFTSDAVLRSPGARLAACVTATLRGLPSINSTNVVILSVSMKRSVKLCYDVLMLIKPQLLSLWRIQPEKLEELLNPRLLKMIRTWPIEHYAQYSDLIQLMVSSTGFHPTYDCSISTETTTAAAKKQDEEKNLKRTVPTL